MNRILVQYHHYWYYHHYRYIYPIFILFCMIYVYIFGDQFSEFSLWLTLYLYFETTVQTDGL